MANRIFEDENHIYQIDFSAAIWATDQLHETFQHNTSSLLSDVDFVAETEDEILLVEYKNAAIPGASNPAAFQPGSQKSRQKIAFKYYDSWLYLHLFKRGKPFHYVYILQYPNGDTTSRRLIRNQIAELLPFRLQSLLNITEPMISAFDVFSIQEWNNNDTYKVFPISPVAGNPDAENSSVG